jgi:biopolymer transport protein ExbB/TolQ
MEFSWSLYDIWQWTNVIERASILTMAVMSLGALYTLLLNAVQQAKTHKAARAEIRVLQQKPILAEAIADLNTRAHPFSMVVLTGLETFQYAPHSVSDIEAVQLAESAMQRCERTIHLDAQLSLVPLDTIANVAPLIGMFATIFGILSSFRGGHDSKATGLQIVSFGLAFALIPLAIGLSVALLSAWGYGTVSRAVERLDAQNTALMQEVVRYLNDQSREQNAGPSEAGATPITRLQKTHHRGTRFVLCALWMWWLLFAIPMGIGLGLGVYSLFTRP